MKEPCVKKKEVQRIFINKKTKKRQFIPHGNPGLVVISPGEEVSHSYVAEKNDSSS